MRRDAALKVLREHKQELEERYGITRLGIFGSVARDEAAGGSDVDVVVEMTPDLLGGKPQRGTGGNSWGKGRSGALLAAYESLHETAHRQGGMLCMIGALLPEKLEQTIGELKWRRSF